MKRLLTAIAAAFVLMSPHLARAEDTKLIILVFVGIQNLPLFAAQCFFAKQGLDVEKHGSRC
jgi:ABC-type nitrate/sulfonate/bicarbonate transport system substrate-binding protein